MPSNWTLLRTLDSQTVTAWWGSEALPLVSTQQREHLCFYWTVLGNLNMTIWLKLKCWRKINSSRLLSWYFSQDTILANIFNPQASQALPFIAFHGTSYLPPALCPPLQQQLRQEFVNEKLRWTGQHAQAMARACRSLHVHLTKTREYRHEIY